MKQSKLLLPIAFILAASAPIITHARLNRLDAFVPVNITWCAVTDKPVLCDIIPDGMICAIDGIIYYQQASPFQTDCMYPYTFNP